MDSASAQAYWNAFERSRLALEDRLIHLPETGQALMKYRSSSFNAETYLHAIPIAAALIRASASSEQTNAQVLDRFSKAGLCCAMDPGQVGYVLTCLSFAQLYRRVSKETGSPDFAKDFSTLICLVCFNYSSLEHIDWAVKAQAEGRRSAAGSWLAPAMLFTVWLTNIESEDRARAVAGMLERFAAYVDKVWQAALKNQAYMSSPWPAS